MADSSTHDAGQVLVQAAKRGDKDAFEVLVRQHAAVVYRQVRGSSGVLVEDADDIAQEVFVHAYRFLGTFRGENSFRSWLYRLTINVTRTYQRRRSRHWRFWADSGEGTETCVIENHSDAVDLEQAYLRRELIEKALNTLPPELRESVVLRDVHGFEYQEIADAMGRFGLATLDLSTGRIEPLSTFDRGKSINPQWGPGGRRLYFLSDATGITNVYAVDFEGHRVRRLTNLDAGVSGITSLSPALTTAADANRIAFSGYEEGRIGIYVIEGRERLNGELLATAPAEVVGASILPPPNRNSNDVAQYLSDPVSGLPEETGSTTAYKPRLSVDAVGQSYVSAGVNRFGAVYGGGISLSFSDMLGTHNLFTSIDTNSYGGSRTSTKTRECLRRTRISGGAGTGACPAARCRT